MTIDTIRETIQRCSDSTEGIYSQLGSVFPQLLSVTKNSGSSSLPALKELLSGLCDNFTGQTDSGSDFFEDWNSRNRDLFTVLGEKMAALDGINTRVAQIRTDSEELEIISLNAMVISIKSGEKGRAFSCITENLKKLSARMISLSDELILDEHRLIEKNLAFKNSVSILLDDVIDDSEFSASDTVSLFQEMLRGAQVDLAQMASDALRIHAPINEAMSGIQLQDIIRQSIDQIILVLEEVVSHSSDLNDENELDRLTLNIELINICLHIAADILKNIDSSISIFSDNWALVHDILVSVESARKSFISTYFKTYASSQNSIPVLLERMTAGFSEHIGQISLYQRGQKSMVRDSSSILTDVKRLRTLFDTIRPIISRLQHVRITQQIEVAKNAVLSVVTDTVAHMSDLIMQADHRVQDTRKELEIFIKEIDVVIRKFGETALVDQLELERIKQARSEFFNCLKEGQASVSSSITDLRVYPDSFQNLCSDIGILFSSLKDTRGSFNSAISMLEVVLADITAERDTLLAKKGVTSWQIQDSRLRELVKKFTITAHKEAAGEIGGFEIDMSEFGVLVSGEVTLF